MTHILLMLKSFKRGVIAMLAITGLLCFAISSASAQTSTGFTIDPSSGSYHIGDTLTVAIRENSGSESTSIASARLSYPADLLQYVSIDASQSKFTNQIAQKIETGLISSSRQAPTPVTGDQLFQKVTFKVISTGTATLSYIDGTMAVGSESMADAAPGRGTAIFNLTAPSATAAVPPSGSSQTSPSAATSAPATSSDDPDKAASSAIQETEQASGIVPAVERMIVRPAGSRSAMTAFGAVILALVAVAGVLWIRWRRYARFAKRLPANGNPTNGADKLL